MCGSGKVQNEEKRDKSENKQNETKAGTADLIVIFTFFRCSATNRRLCFLYLFLPFNF